MWYRLTGFTSATDTRPTFLIPVFRDDSGKAYAQDLDAEYYIRTFLAIDVQKFAPVSAPVPSIRRRSGGEGVLGVAWPDGSVNTGSVSEIQHILRETALEELDSPFFAIEALYVLGPSQRLVDAVNRAGLKFRSKKTRNAWIKSTAYLTTIPRRDLFALSIAASGVDPELAEIIRRLTLAPELRDWGNLWRTAWKKFKDVTLLNIAISWIPGHVNNNKQGVSVLRSVLKATKGRQDVVDLATSWLQNSDPAASSWAPIWLDVMKYQTTPALLDLGEIFLDQTPQHTVKRKRSVGGIQRWVQVWHILTGTVGLSDGVLYRTRNVARLMRSDLRFAGVLLEICERDIPANEWAYRELLSFLSNSEAPTNLWTSLYLRLLSLQEPTWEVVEIGLRWLRTGFPNLKSWVSVWRRLRSRCDDTFMIVIAHDWLLRANPQMSIWPEVLLELLQSDFPMSYELRQKAERWVSHGRRNVEQRGAIEVLMFGGAKTSHTAWRNEVLLALHQMGGEAGLPEIYAKIRENRNLRGGSVPKTLEAIVRRELQRHSSDSKAFAGTRNWFYATEANRWGVRASAGIQSS